MPTADAANGTPKASGVAKKPLKILMLHGYTQSGPLFHSKTKALEKFLVKALAPSNVVPQLIYPSAPNRLLPSDVPGFEPSNSATAATTSSDTTRTTSTTVTTDGPDMRAWFRRDEATNSYRLLDEGMAAIATAIAAADGIHGICGFSQGAATAALVAAALEPARAPPPGPAGDWARGLRAANAGRAALFAVAYSGFRALPQGLAWLFEPAIKTPSMHYIGSLDTVVDEGRSRALADACEDPVVMVHPGGHYVPIARDWAMPLAAFIKKHAVESENKL
ncbi:Ovarian cancer-associated protein-like protein [Escovopsis weberi]|uniref:Ovarian cancer-associated protein-like protein n=1 Tax=Escovopsis weberi TaxID=150374 RepID=A0A0M8N142_ESCWE|nr:Ovarian cancer-associated protein-like protein [Escovopsis weberi]